MINSVTCGNGIKPAGLAKVEPKKIKYKKSKEIIKSTWKWEQH
jgi:hypothetical protein